ncbi:hypothetical protein MMC14_010073 [Varicellaria rhodocarpa]|nr:hypothetical protein [Varicellaria rhodocarpa]
MKYNIFSFLSLQLFSLVVVKSVPLSGEQDLLPHGVDFGVMGQGPVFTRDNDHAKMESIYAVRRDAPLPLQYEGARLPSKKEIPSTFRRRDAEIAAHTFLRENPPLVTNRNVERYQIQMRGLLTRELIMRNQERHGRMRRQASNPLVARKHHAPKAPSQATPAAAAVKAPAPHESKKESKKEAKAAKKEQKHEASVAKQNAKHAETAAKAAEPKPKSDDYCAGKHGIKHSLCETGRHAKNFGHKLKHDFQKVGNGIKTAAKKVGNGIKTAAKKVGHGLETAGKAVYNKVLKPVGKDVEKAGKAVYNKVLKPGWKWVKKNGKMIAIEVGTAIGGALLDVATLGAATPATAALEGAVTSAEVAGNAIKDGVEVGKGVKDAVTVGKDIHKAAEVGKGVKHAEQAAKEASHLHKAIGLGKDVKKAGKIAKEASKGKGDGHLKQLSEEVKGGAKELGRNKGAKELVREGKEKAKDQLKDEAKDQGKQFASQEVAKMQSTVGPPATGPTPGPRRRRRAELYAKWQV